MSRPTVVVAGLGDTGVLVATRLARSCRVIAVTTRPALVSGQELGTRLVDPERWKRNYFLALSRFRKLDSVDIRHGRITAVDLGTSTVHIESIDHSSDDIHYDALVIATGVSNGFWRDDRLQSIEDIESALTHNAQQLSSARTIAVVGGGATGVSVADNLARSSRSEVHLFVSGAELLPQHHPKVRRWITCILQRDGVNVHTGHRALLPDGTMPDRITSGPVEWMSGQPPFVADAVVWAVGSVRPHSSFLPADVLDADGFVRVDDHLCVPGHHNVFAVGDVAASDPLRSSARNWGHRVIVRNVRAVLRGRRTRARFHAPAHRWGSVLGMQRDGLIVASPRGGRFRVPRLVAEPLLFRLFVLRGLYGGLRRGAPR